jgi:hypothetical protein
LAKVQVSTNSMAHCRVNSLIGRLRGQFAMLNHSLARCEQSAAEIETSLIIGRGLGFKCWSTLEYTGV